jgi:transmembrane 9 superfamily member 2/4
VNKLTSAVTLLPIEYYRGTFCQPPHVELESENLGEFLAGDRIENSPYVLKMKKDSYCTHLCQLNVGRGQQKDDGATAGKMKMMRTRRNANAAKNDSKMVKMIRHQYHANWIVDNLPSASISEEFVDGVADGNSVTKYWQGFPIGFVLRTTDDPADVGLAYINNHVNINIKYHKWENDKSMYRVVQFLVEPLSIAHTTEPDTSSSETAYKITNPTASCKKDSTTHTTRDMANRVGPQLAEGPVLFTYDVIWTEDPDTVWSTRWDIYLNMNNTVPGRVHWISIANSMVIVVVLSSMIVAILIRNLRRDINRYNKLATEEEKAEDLEEYGWKLVHADVFRPPTASPLLLAVMCGTGAQLLGMSISTICFSALGFMSPARRGHLLMAELLLFVTMGMVAGFVTARYYKTFKGPNWQRATLCTAFGFPGLVFGMFLILNIVAAVQGSSDRVPFFTMFIIIVLWFGISTPLVFFGAYFGYKMDAMEFPVNTSSIPRQIPDQPWFMGIPFTLAIGGILPFGACFVELYYILASAWMDFYYYVFGFLLLVFIILIITCAEITVLFTYFQLCSENYHWWWRSFTNGGSTAIYVFLYSIVYFQQLEGVNSKSVAVATYMLYFGYMFLASLALFMMMGYVGVTASLHFNKVIFASIKID